VGGSVTPKHGLLVDVVRVVGVPANVVLGHQHLVPDKTEGRSKQNRRTFQAER
jgi:hypothetical protein